MAKDGIFHISRTIAPFKSNKLRATGKEENKNSLIKKVKREENNPKIVKKTGTTKSLMSRKKIPSSPHHPILWP